MKKLGYLMLVILLGSCGAVDGYSFEKMETNHNKITVYFVDYESNTDFNSAADRYNALKIDRDLKAFSSVNRQTGECTIHMFNPSKRYSPEWVGHEVYHCRYGSFHK